MALTRTQIDAFCTKLQGTRDLSSGGVLALKEVLNLLNDEIAAAEAVSTALLAKPYVLHTADATLTEAQTALGNGVTITLDTPAGFLEFKV